MKATVALTRRSLRGLCYRAAYIDRRTYAYGIQPVIRVSGEEMIMELRRAGSHLFRKLSLAMYRVWSLVISRLRTALAQ
jgi:hypothetical protein